MPRFARLFLFSFCLLPFALIGQERQFIFDHFRAVFVQPGVDNMDVDEFGRLWFGTNGRGMFCFDGYDSHAWEFDAADSLTLGSDRVFSTVADRRQRIWAGTLNSLNYLDRRTGLVRRWPSVGDTIFQFHEIYEDRTGQIWAASRAGTPDLLRFEEETGQFLAISPENGGKPAPIYDFGETPNGQLWAASNASLLRIDGSKKRFAAQPVSLKNGEKTGRILALCPLDDGKIWLGADSGVFVFDPETGLANRAELPDSLARWQVSDLLFAEDGQFWFALRAHGLACWNPKTGAWRHFQARSGDESSQLFSFVLKLQTDPFGNLWFGGSQREIGRLNLRPQPISLWQMRPLEAYSQRLNSMFRFAEDRLGQLLACTAHELYFVEKWGQPARPIQLDPLDAAIEIPYDFFAERNGQLWAASNFLLEWEAEKRRFVRRFERETGPFGSLFALEQDLEKEAIFWLGTGKGLLRLDRKNGQTQLFRNINSTAFQPNVHLIRDDGTGYLWLDVDGGLCRFDKKTAEISLFNHQSPEPRRLTNNEVLDINRAPDGTIWVATMGGINLIDPKTGQWQSLTRADGLPDNLMLGTLFDRDGNAWINSPEELIFRNRTTGQLKIIDKTAVLKAGSWTRGKWKCADGRFLLSSTHGLIEVKPEEIQLLDNQEVATILLTNFEVVGEPFGARKGAFEFLQNVQLAAVQNDLAFEWAGIQTARSQGLRYQYRLDGLHKNWVDAGSERRAAFANLSPGSYSFRVKMEGSNDQARELAFHFVIAPPWYQTAWFRMLAGLLVLVAAVVFYQNRKAQQLLRQQKELAEQNSRYKTRFLANVSHEIRTPMNAIVGLSRLLTEADLPTKPKDYAEAIRQSSENLLVLINDVLDQAKIESGKFSFQHRPFDLALIIRHLQQTLGIRAAEKGLDFEVIFEENLPMQVIGDPVRLTQILTNLVGNSIKFTEKGQVKLEIGDWGMGIGEVAKSPFPNPQSPIYNFTISDTGIGIEDERLERVFESFQQADDDIAATYGGTGLGLSITKQLVEQQGGKIWLESEVGRGTTFFVELPFEVKQSTQSIENQVIAPIFEFPKLKILLVEDTFFNQMLAIELLESRLPDVEIVVAENGQIALEKIAQTGSTAQTNQPITDNQSTNFDLILMDVKMPVMDGLEATRRIRRLPDSRMCRLPIIGLTANAVAGELEKCRAVGMNGWVTKPIDSEEFFATMARVLEARKPSHPKT